MKILICMLIGFAAIADSPSFEVKEISAQEQDALQVLMTKFQQAAERSRTAQREEEQAAKEYQAKSEEIANRFSPSPSSVPCSGGFSTHRGVEIRGKYALITETKEECDVAGGTLTNRVGLLSHPIHLTGDSNFIWAGPPASSPAFKVQYN